MPAPSAGGWAPSNDGTGRADFGGHASHRSATGVPNTALDGIRGEGDGGHRHDHPGPGGRVVCQAQLSSSAARKTVKEGTAQVGGTWYSTTCRAGAVVTSTMPWAIDWQTCNHVPTLRARDDHGGHPPGPLGKARLSALVRSCPKARPRPGERVCAGHSNGSARCGLHPSRGV